MISFDDNSNINSSSTIIEGVYLLRCISSSITRHFVKWKHHHLKFDTNNDYINIIGNAT